MTTWTVFELDEKYPKNKARVAMIKEHAKQTTCPVTKTVLYGNLRFTSNIGHQAKRLRANIEGIRAADVKKGTKTTKVKVAMKVEPSTIGEGVNPGLSTKQVAEFENICVVYEQILEKLDGSLSDIAKYPFDIPPAVEAEIKELRSRAVVEFAELKATMAATTSYNGEEAKELKGNAKNANTDAVRLFKKVQSLTKESRVTDTKAADSEAKP